MKRVVGGSLVLPLCLSMGCSTSGGGSGADPTGSGANGGGGNNSSYGGVGASLFNPTTGGSTSSPVTSTGLADADVCAGDHADAQLTQVNILVLLDKSGSMGYQHGGAGDWDNCADRWNPVVQTLKAFFGQSDSSRLYASLSFLPADGGNTAMCDPKTYLKTDALKVKLTLLDDAGRQKFQDRLCDCVDNQPATGTCILPAGGTPTRPALQGTIDYMGTVNKTYPDSKSVIVLITDGEPSFACQNSAGATQVCNSCEDLTNGCLTDSTSCLDHDTEIQRISAVIQSAPAKSIYVVGVGTNLSDSTLSDWSDASGNLPVDLRSLDGPAAALKLMDTLQSIRSSSISCEFILPKTNITGTIDPDKTFVYYTPGSGAAVYLAKTADGTAATCSSSAKTWYFDNPKMPTKIDLCTTACDALQADSKGSLSVEYGCTQHPYIF